MKTIKNILLSLLFSNAIASNILIVCHLIFRLIFGNFEYNFSLLNYCVIAVVLFIGFILDFYTLDKFVIEKSSDIYDKLNDILFIPFMFAFLVEISDIYFKKKRYKNKNNA